MLNAIVHFNGQDSRQEVIEILTYLRGEGHWQLMCLDGTLKIVPETSIEMLEIVNTVAPPPQKIEKEDGKEEA
jgi:hypothetical protein